jgi:uncharacterized hydrophobic protein (TIGR00271 family)
MGLLSRIIDAGGEHRMTLADVEDGLFIGRGSRSAKLSQYWVLLVLASIIGAGGVIGDSTPAVIGAMIVAPLATPIYGIALATVIGSRRDLRDALLLLVAGIAVNILIGLVMARLTFDRMPIEANLQIVSRTAPAILDLVVAIAVGVAGAFALVRRDIGNILAGVAIAISLVPVLEVVGIALGSGRLDLAWGAFLLFLTNAAAIIVTGVVVFTAAGYASAAAERLPHAGRRAKVLIATLVIALAIPLSITSLSAYRYQRWMNSTEKATLQWAADTGWRVTNVRQAGDEIVATVAGSGEPPSIEKLRALVRQSVPTAVRVRLIEESGSDTEL